VIHAPQKTLSPIPTTKSLIPAQNGPLPYGQLKSGGTTQNENPLFFFTRDESGKSAAEPTSH
jgi:hypothetical protein